MMQGENGVIRSARPGQIVVEFGSHPIPAKERQIAPLAAKGAAFIDGEVSGTPGMVAARKAVIYLGGDAAACRRLEPVVAGFADSCIYFGPFGAATKVKLVNNLLVAINIAATAEAMALGLKAGVDVDLMIKAIATGSGGSTQFGIRAPWMAQRRFLPVQGNAAGLSHYFHMIEEWADATGTATPLLDRAREVYRRCIDQGLEPGVAVWSTHRASRAGKDVAVLVDVIGANAAPQIRIARSSRARENDNYFAVAGASTRRTLSWIGGRGRRVLPASITKFWSSVYHGALTSDAGGVPLSWRT